MGGRLWQHGAVKDHTGPTADGGTKCTLQFIRATQQSQSDKFFPDRSLAVGDHRRSSAVEILPFPQGCQEKQNRG